MFNSSFNRHVFLLCWAVKCTGVDLCSFLWLLQDVRTALGLLSIFSFFPDYRSYIVILFLKNVQQGEAMRKATNSPITQKQLQLIVELISHL